MEEYFDQIPESLRGRRDVSWTAKGVYAYLRRAVAAGFHPGARRIGDACGISKNTATKALAILVSAHLIEHEAGVKGRRSRYRIFSTVPDSGTVEPSQNMTQTVPGAGKLNIDQPSQTLTHTVPDSGTPAVPGSGTPPSQTLGHIQSKSRVSNQSKSRATGGDDSKEFDLDTPLGVWKHFGAAFVSKHDSAALGMFTGAASQRARGVVAMGLTPTTLRAEVDAYVAALDWQPDDPWMHFAAKVGDWQRRAKASGGGHRRGGRAVVPKLEDRPPGDDPDEVFAAFETQGAA